MDYCYLCGDKFDNIHVKQHNEHIIQNAIGGVLVSPNILCEKCGGQLGHTVDDEFVKIFSPISELLGIRIQRKNKKNISEVLGRLDKIDVGIDLVEHKIYPIVPFYEFDKNSNVLKVFAQSSIIKNYAQKAKKDIERMGDTGFEILLIDNLKDEYSGTLEVFFNMNDNVFKRGLAKIAIGFAFYNGIHSKLLCDALDTDKKDVKDSLAVIPYIPCGIFDYYFELHRDDYDEEYPQHNLLLFTTSYMGKKTLVCFIELFGTFQHYIILNQNYTGEDCFYSFGQKIFDPGSTKVESPLDYKMLPQILSNLAIPDETEKKKIEELYFTGNEAEAITKINDYLFRGRYFYDYHVCMKAALDNMIERVNIALSALDNQQIKKMVKIKDYDNAFALCLRADIDKYANFVSSARCLFQENDDSNEFFVSERFRRYHYHNGHLTSYCDFIIKNQGFESIKEYCYLKFILLRKVIAKQRPKMFGL